MKINYRAYKPRGDSQLIIVYVNRILQEYADQGFDLTLRQLYYQMIARDLFPESWADEDGIKNRQENYNRLKNLVSRGREGGLIDWEHIKDRGRTISQYLHFRDPGDFIRRVANSFNLDMWENQETRPVVWYEKDALSQIVETAADPYDVPSFATKGYASASSVWDAAHNYFLRWAQKDQKILVLHLADHDPSGVHMTEDLLERIGLFASPYDDGMKRPRIKIRRIALNMAQVRQYNPPDNPVKESDSRMPAYVANYGTEHCWELDALEPNVMVELIREEIMGVMDTDLYDERRQLEREYSDQLHSAASQWSRIVEILNEQ